MTLITQGGGLTSFVDPNRGGKIFSLVDAQGTEWLAQADPNAAPASGSPFVKAEMAGWDECAPSIVACTIGGRSVPDHGDLWDIPFEVVGGTVSATGISLGYRFERTIMAVDGGLLLSYEAEALTERIPFLWAAHPQFVAPPGTYIELPDETPVVIDVQDSKLPSCQWSLKLATIDSVSSGGTRKLFVDPATPVHSAELVRSDGSRLSIEWSRQCPYLGLWFDNAAFSREPVIAVEPSTGYFDSLETAASANRVSVLDPGHPMKWWVRLSAGSGS